MSCAVRPDASWYSLAGISAYDDFFSSQDNFVGH